MQASRHPLFANLIRFAVLTYRNTLSVSMLGSCRFFPTCSEYALEAVARHGVIRGGLRAAKRLLRCHSCSPGGADPVDE